MRLAGQAPDRFLAVPAQRPMSAKPAPALAELRPGQSIELLKALHILTRDGQLNQDSRRKLKQVYHLYQFIEKLLQELTPDGSVSAARQSPHKLPVDKQSAELLSLIHISEPTRPY